MDKLARTLQMLIIALMSSCTPTNHYSYGTVMIAMPDGQKVYFKREVGFDHDLWVISPSDDVCHMPNADTDYWFHQMGPIDPLYKIKGDTILLYIRGVAAAAPKGGQFPTRIIQKEVDPLDYLKMESDLEKLGLTRLEVRIDESITCGR
jgi:hypothetical protein